GDPDTGGTMDSGGGGNDAGSCDKACCFFPDSCGDGQNCYRTRQGRQCAQFNSNKKEGDSCSGGNDCDDGLICNTQTGKCRAKCNPDDLQNYGCPDQRSCLGLADQQGNQLAFGLCQPTCEPWPNDSCPQGQNCYPNPTVQGDQVCLPYGDKAEGESCRSLTDCGKDLLCNPNSGKCTAKCNDSNPCQADGKTCQQTQQLSYGICVSQ
ncbi:MAG: hypothetical protein ABEN55_19625, partial [Bradymonadaceae bacterium]